VVPEPLQPLVKQLAELNEGDRDKHNAPDLPEILAEVRRWYDDEQIEFVQSEFETLYPRILDVVGQSGSKLNFNDAA
jgi:hypothetical protein